MQARNDGGPAFPAWELNGDGQPEMACFGMTLRDHFAAKAMAALITGPMEDFFIRSEGAKIAIDAYKMADAMLAEREK